MELYKGVKRRQWRGGWDMTFSIIVVCLNAGIRLHDTVESIRRQTEEDYEIIVKDGISEDKITTGYLSKLERESAADGRIRVYRHDKDSGIYKAPCIFYGNICEYLTGTMVQSNPVIDDFACYRNLPCHQACFYAAALLRERAFDTGYRVRADYEHFLWCRYIGGARTVYMPVTVALYEGGGFSETKVNKRRSKQEHKEIVLKYMPGRQVFWYRMIMLLTLAPLRTWIAGNPAMAGIYQSVKKRVYKA